MATKEDDVAYKYWREARLNTHMHFEFCINKLGRATRKIESAVRHASPAQHA